MPTTCHAPAEAAASKYDAVASRLLRVRDAAANGRALAPEDSTWLAASIERILGGQEVAPALGLDGHWRRGLKAELVARAIFQASTGIPGFGEPDRGREVAAELQRRLSTYASGTYRFDARSTPPADRAALFAVLHANDGEVPSLGTVRRVYALWVAG